MIKIDKNELTNCCHEPFIEDTDFCSKCKEHSYYVYSGLHKGDSTK